jgi:hypothetical protein
MKPIRRKLSLHAETLRQLGRNDLSHVAGGIGTVMRACSTMEDSNCCHTGADCDTSACPSANCLTASFCNV